MTLIRASVIFLYIQIFCTSPVRIACFGLLAINVAYFTGTVLACCLICRPFAYNWDQSIHGTCGDQKSLDLFIGIFNFLMDIATIALPMPVLWGLQMPTGRKAALSGIFSLVRKDDFAFVLPSLRPTYSHIIDGYHNICIITLVRIKVTTDINAYNTAAQYALIALLTCLESSLGVVNACLPVMKPIFDKLKPSSLISAMSAWTSSKRSVPSREHEMPSKPKQDAWPLESQPARIMQWNSQDSTAALQEAI